MYSNKDICACIISYNDAEAIIENIDSIVTQVSHVIVIDNASGAECVERLKSLQNRSNIEVIFDTKNRGISIQLNKALDYCKQHKYSLLLTMDQDTKLHNDSVNKMISVINKYHNIGSIGPNRDYPKWKGESDYVEKNYIITSGSVVVVDRALEVGGYNNDLFVDMVDVDFSLSLRCAGYSVGCSVDATMSHKVGEKEKNRIAGINVEYYSHTPERFYYIYKNRQIVCKRFFRRMPVYCIKMWVGLFMDTFTLFIEKKGSEKFKMALRGAKDGLRYRIR